MKKILLAGAASAALYLPAFAADTRVAGVDVEFDLEAVKSKEAAAFWSDLENDLESAIILRVGDRTGKTGSHIRIDIDEFSMANSFQSAMGADSRLMGDINVRHDTDRTKNSFYDLTITLDEAGRVVPTEEGVDVQTVTQEAAYTALVDAFADGVVSRLR